MKQEIHNNEGQEHLHLEVEKGLSTRFLNKAPHLNAQQDSISVGQMPSRLE